MVAQDVASALLSTTLATASVLGVLGARWHAPDAHDGAYVRSAVPWALWLGLGAYLGSAAWAGAPHALAAMLSRLAYQGMLWASAALLWMGARQGSAPPRSAAPRVLRWLLLTSALGLAAWAQDADRRALWLGGNALAGGLFTLCLIHRVRAHPSTAGWMALLLSIFGCSVVVTDLAAVHGQQPSVGLHHLLQLLALFCFWLALRHGAQVSEPPPGWMSRRQLAQELHDGVGAQLVSILSTLDANLPQQRQTATLLQSCLLDLKLMVDGMEPDASLLSHLASLRYRMQPLMEQAGVRVNWLISDETELARVQGAPAKQLLRVVQEALANVVQHAGARVVTVSCCYSAELASVYLSIADDGCGLSKPARQGGKGLEGMRARVQTLGGQFIVESEVQLGTFIQLLLPTEGLRASQRQGGSSTTP